MFSGETNPMSERVWENMKKAKNKNYYEVDNPYNKDKKRRAMTENKRFLPKKQVKKVNKNKIKQ